MPVMPACTGAQDETAPEDHRNDEDDAGQGKNRGRKPKRPTTSAQRPLARCCWLNLMLSHVSSVLLQTTHLL